ncbi:MAG: DUF2469 family protein [Actinomycetota bacterium]|nr:DUF2469 domain-containing protein [Actinomycetota bacterium]
MGEDDLEKFEAELELGLYREFRDVLPMFRFVVETERRTYLCNSCEVKKSESDQGIWFDLTLKDAWVWDFYRPSRFANEVRVVSFTDFNIEEVVVEGDRLPMDDLA